MQAPLLVSPRHSNSNGELHDEDDLAGRRRIGVAMAAPGWAASDAECQGMWKKADVYTPRKADAGAPLKGANSFTEGQAKDRAVAHGNVASVSGPGERA